MFLITRLKCTNEQRVWIEKLKFIAFKFGQLYINTLYNLKIEMVYKSACSEQGIVALPI